MKKLPLEACAQAYCRISTYRQSIAAIGCNPLVAIETALESRAAGMIGIPEEAGDLGGGVICCPLFENSRKRGGRVELPLPKNRRISSGYSAESK